MTMRTGMIAALAAALTMMGPAGAAQPDGHSAPEGQEVGLQYGGRWVLRDHRGRVIYDRDLHGKLVLIYFGYTFCPDICPTALQTVTQALDLLGDDAKEVQPLFITVDPQRDTPEILKEYVGAFHPSLLGLTGPQEYIDSVIGKFHVKVEKVEMQGVPGGYVMDHTSSLFLMGREGEFLERIPHGTGDRQLADILRGHIAGGRD